MQNCLMVYGGSIESGDDAFVNQLHVFNFTTMSWSKPPLPESRMGYRSGHMATNHNDHLIIAGGESIICCLLLACIVYLMACIALHI